MKIRNCGNCFIGLQDDFDGTCGEHGEIGTNYCCKDHKFVEEVHKMPTGYTYSIISKEGIKFKDLRDSL